MSETTVIIVGAGPSGLAIAACLSKLSIPYILLERENCYAPLWKNKTYDRLHLHLPKQYGELPHMKLPKNCPNYVPKKDFIEYLDNYVAHFGIKPLYGRNVVSSKFDKNIEKWRVIANKIDNNGEKEKVEEFVGKYLVVASGETSDPFCPEIEGLSSFQGKIIHSTEYKNGKEYKDKNVMVVGAGNSGIEISLDLANHGVNTSVVVRSPIHILSREMVSVGLFLLKHLPFKWVDNLMVMLSKLYYGDITKYGLTRPIEGPFYLKAAFGKYPIIDVGAFSKIKSGQIQILPGIKSIRGNEVAFEDDKSYLFDAIIFATGFKRSTSIWLQGDDYLLNDDGISKINFPNNWKGRNGLYCVGLARKGLYGATMDAQNISQDINTHLNRRQLRR